MNGFRMEATGVYKKTKGKDARKSATREICNPSPYETPSGLKAKPN